MKSYLSSLSFLLSLKWKGGDRQTGVKTDQRILLSSLSELFFVLFWVMLLSFFWSYHLPSFSKPPCAAGWRGKRGTERGKHPFGARAATASVAGWWRKLERVARHPGLILTLQLLHCQGTSALGAFASFLLGVIYQDFAKPARSRKVQNIVSATRGDDLSMLGPAAPTGVRQSPVTSRSGTSSQSCHGKDWH